MSVPVIPILTCLHHRVTAGAKTWGYLLLSILLCSTLLPAQNTPHPSFRHFTTDDGLPSPEVYSLLQDRQGYIWISTDNGVSRYDGYEFRNFSVKDGLMEHVIVRLQLDDLGRVWMLSLSCNLYYVEGEKVFPYWNNNVIAGFQDKIGKSAGFVVEGAGDTIHVGTWGAGMITIAKNGSTKNYSQEEACYIMTIEKGAYFVPAFYRNPDYKVATDFTNELTLQKRCYPLYFQSESALWSYRNLQYSKQEGFNANSVLRLKNGLYLYMRYQDAWLISHGAEARYHYFPQEVIYANQMKNGQLFIGLHQHEGLRVYETVEDFFKNKFSTWLPGQSVSYFIEDREGGKWFATNDNGLYYAPANTIEVYDRETDLPDEKVTAITIKNERELYVGLNSGEVFHLDIPESQWTKLPPVPKTAFIRDLYYDQHTASLWAGRFDLYCLENDNWISKGLTTATGLFSVSNRITTNPDGHRLWGCNQFGFLGLKLPGAIPDISLRGQNQRTFIVREDYDQRIWVGQTKGLFEWKNDSLYSRSSLHPAFALRVEDIALAPDSTLLVGTKGGGVVFWRNNRFEQFTTSEGLTSDMIECVYVDGKGVAWVGTLNGLNRISGNWDQRKVEQITIAHGLPSNEINRIVSWKNIIWIATNKGLVRLEEKPYKLFSPKPILTSVLTGKRPLNLAIFNRIAFRENNLTFNYLALNFKLAGQITYRSRMDGSEWSMAKSMSQVIPALPAGNHVFEVQAQNEDGVWSEGTFFRFYIRPPWWQTWWFRSVVILLIASIVYGVFRYRTRQLKHENELQKQMTALKHSALQAQMHPHFIFNCLNSIQNFILQNEKEEAIYYLGSFAKLVRGMLNASTSGKISLEDELELLKNYLALEQLRFKNSFSYEINTAEGIDTYDLEIPPLLVQPYVENAVLHGVSGKETGGKVTVFFEVKGDFLEVTITDNGKGLSGNQVQQGIVKKHKSVGMTITHDRLELLFGKKEGDIVKTRNLFDEEGHISGMEVTIQIGLATENTATNMANE
jgi:ligand-binding sensor domain-containing protein